jgi:hypothetical protein
MSKPCVAGRDAVRRPRERTPSDPRIAPNFTERNGFSRIPFSARPMSSSLWPCP